MIWDGIHWKLDLIMPRPRHRSPSYRAAICPGVTSFSGLSAVMMGSPFSALESTWPILRNICRRWTTKILANGPARTTPDSGTDLSTMRESLGTKEGSIGTIKLNPCKCWVMVSHELRLVPCSCRILSSWCLSGCTSMRGLYPPPQIPCGVQVNSWSPCGL